MSYLVPVALAEPPAPDHAADALAVAICHHNAAPFQAAVARGSARPAALAESVT